MRNRIVKVTEVVVRSAFYIISNYVFVSMGLSFHTQWISILFLLSMVWSTIDYGKSINEIIEMKIFQRIPDRRFLLRRTFWHFGIFLL